MSSRYEFPDGQKYILFVWDYKLGTYIIDQVDDEDYFDADWEGLTGFVATLSSDGVGEIDRFYSCDRHTSGSSLTSTDLKEMEEIAAKAADLYDAFVVEQNRADSALKSFTESVDAQVVEELTGVTLDSLYARLESLTVEGHYEMARNGYYPGNIVWDVKGRAQVRPQNHTQRFPVEFEFEETSHLRAVLRACILIDRWRENPANEWTIQQFDVMDKKEKS